MSLYVFLCTALLMGCAGSKSESANFVRPSVAVMKFENRAAFPMRWDLGSGTRDILVDRLMKTGRYQVIERPEIGEIVRELNFQQSGLTRPQDKAALGQIKNVQYLIKGVITDFSQVGGGSAHATKGSFGIFGGGSRAVVTILLYVVNVESAEIIASESIEESVDAGEVNFQAMYKDVNFGGSGFYKTPLGKATARVIDRAVARITSTIAAERWSPRVAALQSGGRILLSGGSDRRMLVGEQFTVMDLGAPVVDPQSGDVLGRQPSKPIATVRVTAVHERYSEAIAISATAPLAVGQQCVRP
jgi:curli biogenesis system outer membrane secretion channel CsgG